MSNRPGAAGAGARAVRSAVVSRAAVAALLALPCGACTIILDPSNLPPQTDAAPIDAPSIDSNPADLAIDRADGFGMMEGVGDDGGRPALIVLHGHALLASATVDAHLQPGTADVSDVQYLPSVDGTQAGVALRIPVLTDLAVGSTRRLHLTVTQAGASASADVDIDGLAEVDLSAAPPALAARYSRITVSGDVHFGGDAPVRLVATAGISLGGKLDVDGATPGAGPQGCAGGATLMVGGCQEGGGKPGVS
ncbi:MAG TPA: hypothetical protein VHE35_25885, partial [Kofleriaceae bacterium]|nr:hypothetical protein [Kofleriaceae bacterium]